MEDSLWTLHLTSISLGGVLKSFFVCGIQQKTNKNLLSWPFMDPQMDPKIDPARPILGDPCR